SPLAEPRPAVPPLSGADSSPVTAGPPGRPFSLLLAIPLVLLLSPLLIATVSGRLRG
ncbi:MAG: hypothetical protein JWR37_5407, partial [Mycobacterium sp.]|nr:hypothetical protein [Mycobacterium sp.]